MSTGWCSSGELALWFALWFVLRYTLRFTLFQVRRAGFPLGCAGLRALVFFDISICPGNLL